MGVAWSALAGSLLFGPHPAPSLSPLSQMDALLREFGQDTDIHGLEMLGDDAADLNALLNAEVSLMEMGDTGDKGLFGDLAL